MTDQARLYGTVLYQLSIPEKMAEEAEKIFETPELMICLTSPAVSRDKKHRIIEKIFQKPAFSDVMIRFFKKGMRRGMHRAAGRYHPGVQGSEDAVGKDPESGAGLCDAAG